LRNTFPTEAKPRGRSSRIGTGCPVSRSWKRRELYGSLRLAFPLSDKDDGMVERRKEVVMIRKQEILCRITCWRSLWSKDRRLFCF